MIIADDFLNKRWRIPTGIQKWTIQKNLQDEEKKKKNTTQYVLDITIRKQIQIM